MSQLPEAPALLRNGDGLLHPGDRAETERQLLAEPLTAGYRPTLPLWQLFTSDAIPQFFLLRDIELMMTHPVIRVSLDFFKGGVGGAEFWGGPDPNEENGGKGKPISDSPEITDFVQAHCHRYWDRGVPKVQGGYEYGWMGLEPTYADEDGRLCWTDFEQFSPRDVFLLTIDGRPAGVRVKNITQPGRSKSMAEGGGGVVDLWSASKDVPAKGVWYAHNPRYSSFYGQSQLLGAWRPWRRLAWRDGAEMVADGGVYRFSYAGPILFYPEEDLQAAVGTPYTAQDSQGKGRRPARDVAKQMCEQLKAGAGMGFPSTHYPSDWGGQRKWEVEWPTPKLNVDHIIAYIKYLIDQIRYGVGVPPEVMEASETGSGYSGRSIPLEGFMLLQQRLADALLLLFVNQILSPLVRWNFGPTAKFNVQVRNLLETKRRAQMGKTPDQRTGMQNGGLPGQNGLMTPSQPSPDGSLPVPGMARGLGAPPQPNAGVAFALQGDERVRVLAELIRKAGRAA